MRNLPVIIFIGIVYDLVVLASLPVIWTLSFMNKKISRYRQARRAFFKTALPPACDVLFVCSSIGELEQVIPLLSLLDKKGQTYSIMFYSDNGLAYAQKLGYTNVFLAPYDFYPLQLKMIRKLNPRKIIIDRHELWPGFILAAAHNRTETFVINYILKERSFFSRSVQRFMLSYVQKVFTVNGSRGTKFIMVGDTKCDRIKQRIVDEAAEIASIVKAKDKRHLVLGNAYPEDCGLLARTLRDWPTFADDWEVWVIPARPQIEEELKKIFQGLTAGNIRIVPVFGKLLHYYAIADLAWVGGGFSRGIHNTLEPYMVHKRMISGPRLDGQPDALFMAEKKFLTIFRNETELKQILEKFDGSGINVERKESSASSVIFESIFYQ